MRHSRPRTTAARAATTATAVLVSAALALSAPSASLAAPAAPHSAAAAAAVDDTGGLRALVDDYRTRTPTEHTAESWAPFAAALDAAQGVVDSEATTPDGIVAAKNALLDAAAGLVTTSEGSFQPITNNTFWNDTEGNPIYSQGGGIFRFGDTYYWYGVRYQEADDYRASPSQLYRNATFESIPVYTSHDLVNWTFQNNVATRDTPLDIPESAGAYFAEVDTLGEAAWIGRLGVSYNENTGKFVLLTQMNNSDPNAANVYSILFLQSDTPAGDFSYGNLQTQVVNSPTRGTGDQTVFTDEDGSDYLVFSNSRGRSSGFVSRIAESDSLSVEPGVLINRNAAGREGNAMFRLDDRYYMAASDLHGWNTSVNYVVESATDDIQGAYSAEFVLPGTQKDYSHVTQTGFFVTVHGTRQDTVLYAGDRWADFAWNGLGYNQWLPISSDETGLQFNSLSNWELNAVTGEWRVGESNNYVLNPDFAADRVAVSQVTGWTTSVDTGYSANAFVGNPSPGADASRFALRLGSANAFSGAVSQQNAMPDGVYRLGAKVSTAGGLEYARAVVTSAGGQRYELDLNSATKGWQSVVLDDIVITGVGATVSLEARSAGGNQSVLVDALSLVADPDRPAWSAATAYAAGDEVYYGGAVWSAAWWAATQPPGPATGPWQEIGVSGGVAVWTPSRIFQAGDRVVHDGREYTAKWWTRDQEPGSVTGPWQPGA